MCIVEKTKWPVSAALNAIEILSASLISPIKITSGSCLKLDFNAELKFFESLPISRWFTILFLWVWIYSIGSSKVIIWHSLFSLIKSIKLASVLDFPLPVGPVIKTNPFCFLVNSLMTSGSFNSSNLGILFGIILSAIA